MSRLRMLPLCALALLTPWSEADRPTARAAEPAPAPTFARDGVAFLAAHCVSCHGADKARADLTLHRFTDDASVLKDRKTWDRVVEVVHAGEMPPPNKPQPTIAETERFAGLVRGIFDRADNSGVVDPGRVTMRRLNRTEYNNTVRDLCYVDFAASEDFPSDDIGYGFDNIGDVLSLPPVLMERYLAAAESAMSRAITPHPQTPPTRLKRTRELLPRLPDQPRSYSWRRIAADPTGDAVTTGPVYATFETPDYGAYVLRTRVYADTADDRPVKVALLATCTPDTPGAATDADVARLSGAGLRDLRPFVILKVIDVTGRSVKTAQVVEAAVPAGVRPGVGGVAVVRPTDGSPAAAVHVSGMQLEGPLDPRPPGHYKLLACDKTAPKPEQTRQVVERFVTRAYRRPATPEQVTRVVALVTATEADGKSWEEAVQFAFTGVLCSPNFLFRAEAAPHPTAAGPHPVGEYQLASRLSYFLWATMPDDELFRLAADGTLSADVESQVRRMLADPKADALVDRFAVQWLQLERLQAAQVDPDLFPKFDEQLKRDMLEETRLFLRAIVREDRSVLDVLSGDFTYLNADLADLYGIRDTAGRTATINPFKRDRSGGEPFPVDGGFVRVNLAGTGRGGVLTQASVLTVTSLPTRTSPVKRGKWVLEQLLGTPPPPPPPNVPELEEAGNAITAGTLRERLEEHRRDPACANCHVKMDAIGFGLENFDAIGRFRTRDGDSPIDAAAVLDGKAFRGPDELRAVLTSRQDQFARCLAEKMLTYALGRGLEYYDKRAVDGIVARMAANDYRFSSLILGVAASDPFRLRRGKDQP